MVDFSKESIAFEHRLLEVSEFLIATMSILIASMDSCLLIAQSFFDLLKTWNSNNYPQSNLLL